MPKLLLKSVCDLIKQVATSQLQQNGLYRLNFATFADDTGKAAIAQMMCKCDEVRIRPRDVPAGNREAQKNRPMGIVASPRNLYPLLTVTTIL